MYVYLKLTIVIFLIQCGKTHRTKVCLKKTVSRKCDEQTKNLKRTTKNKPITRLFSESSLSLSPDFSDPSSVFFFILRFFGTFSAPSPPSTTKHKSA